MVMAERIQSKFAQCFKKALFLKYGGIPSASFLANNFNLRSYDSRTITRETARKWLTGATLPEAERLKTLIQWLNLDPLEFMGNHNASSNDHARAIERSEFFSEKILDALSSQLAVVDEVGQIVQVNKKWREFALGNEAPEQSEYFERYNYLRVCENAKGFGAQQAKEMAAGIRSVIAQEKNEFALKYPCHAPHKKRWYVARVSPLNIDGKRYAIITHESVSEKNYQLLNL